MSTATTTSWAPYEAPGWLPGGQLQTIYAHCLAIAKVRLPARALGDTGLRFH